MGRLLRGDVDAGGGQAIGVHAHTGTHEHSHAHPHRHPDPGETVAPIEPTGAICVDVGARRGALLLRSSPERAGLEVEIHPVSDPSARTHVWVLPRETGTGAISFAGVFPSLVPGRYAVLEPGDVSAHAVEVMAGIVTVADWR